MSEASLPSRFRGQLEALLPGSGQGGPHLVVAVSGGLDSTVLLHLLRFQTRAGSVRLTAAHLDHRMREGSPTDAAWVCGLCRAWSVGLVSDTAREPPRSEDQARRIRYAFLRETVSQLHADALLTAHHADDQAETVLFRVLRGTGIGGLRGIPARTRTGIVRPLLPFWREELHAYAIAHHLRWRADSTNETLGAARNRIRNALLPALERQIAPGARRSLVALAELARESESGWNVLVGDAEKRLVRYEEGVAFVARADLRGYHPAFASRILRKVLRQFGNVPGRIGTRSALQFITDAPSGREIHLPGGVRIRTEFEVARIERREVSPPDRPVEIDGIDTAGKLATRMRLGGRTFRVTATRAVGSDEIPRCDADEWVARLPVARLRFPLRLRARRPGDRIATPRGSRSLKRLMIDRRIPGSERHRRPVLEDAEGTILWVAGVGSVPLSDPDPDEEMLYLAIRDDGGE
ncbi:MAG: tRNA lysidine(34) synthetase TilS [Gemmatimonas sp.]|nr:tRNA lysidine(34) synthetase TilS [Gemmatimonas sp.]